MASESKTVNLKRRPAPKPAPRWNLAGISFGVSVVALFGAGYAIRTALQSQKQLTGSR